MTPCWHTADAAKSTVSSELGTLQLARRRCHCLSGAREVLWPLRLSCCLLGRHCVPMARCSCASPYLEAGVLAFILATSGPSTKIMRRDLGRTVTSFLQRLWRLSIGWWRQDALTVQLVMTFVRNLLAVADPRATECGKGYKAGLRQELLGRLLDEHVLELLLTVAQHTDEARA